MRGGSELELRKSNLPAESDLELGLGLSLGGGAWRERGRILTAKDFPSVGSKRALLTLPPLTMEHLLLVQGVNFVGFVVSSQVVGWPPVGSHRMNSLVNKQAVKGEQGDGKKKVMKEDEPKDVSVKGSGFVKVNKDGVGIGRKVDVRAHSSYENLAQTLEEMFFGRTGTASVEKVKPLRLLDGSSEFVLTYEDKEGDWMLVGDVPWRMFITSVKRLRIMGTSEASGLAQLRYIKEAEEIRLAMQPLDLIKRVREIEQEGTGGQETEQQKQNTAVDLSKRLKDFASSLKALEEWRKRKMERARQRDLEKTGGLSSSKTS
ncbi:hypothetical protein IGI04_039017 [Brassica rapa subsp. trilocularis]|uniref:Auxin-responsive protein n=1 Tax=Brassica rapa subsp. trilocularis TaxID=1813537 RepID=A0ABQ7LLW7_BRACM|nr:hypothetical protein IGI04_039017 [Brassica rapa subsp. trilocularis]